MLCATFGLFERKPLWFGAGGWFSSRDGGESNQLKHYSRALGRDGERGSGYISFHLQEGTRRTGMCHRASTAHLGDSPLPWKARCFRSREHWFQMSLSHSSEHCRNNLGGCVFKLPLELPQLPEWELITVPGFLRGAFSRGSLLEGGSLGQVCALQIRRVRSNSGSVPHPLRWSPCSTLLATPCIVGNLKTDCE